MGVWKAETGRGFTAGTVASLTGISLLFGEIRECLFSLVFFIAHRLLKDSINSHFLFFWARKAGLGAIFFLICLLSLFHSDSPWLNVSVSSLLVKGSYLMIHRVTVCVCVCVFFFMLGKSTRSEFKDTAFMIDCLFRSMLC